MIHHSHVRRCPEPFERGARIAERLLSGKDLTRAWIMKTLNTSRNTARRDLYEAERLFPVVRLIRQNRQIALVLVLKPQLDPGTVRMLTDLRG